jgi:hypothetical protein
MVIPFSRSNKQRSVHRILGAYVDDRPFSVELVGAVRCVAYMVQVNFTYACPEKQVLRQGSFVKKMHGLLWTQPDFFESQEDEVALQHAIARYHAFACFFFLWTIISCLFRFLDLMTSSPVSFFVPTLDIDLAWHTHQLMAVKYNKDCRDYVGRFVDQ